jgi:ElaB/YqjD/DUF883 family membrane-anchored ribosome-binding protein
MTTSQDPDEIRAEIERTRAAVSDDVNRLAETANPKNVARRQVDNLKENVRDKAVGLKERIMGSDDDDSGTSVVGTLQDKAAGVAGSVQDKAAGIAGSVQDTAAGVRDSVAETAAGARDSVQQAPAKVKSRTRGNPLAAGVIAFGAGMLVSGLIPSTRTEQRAVSQLQDKVEPLKQQAGDVAREMADNLKGSAQEAVQSVKETATDAAQTVKDQGASAADDVRSQAAESKDNVQSAATSSS